MKKLWFDTETGGVDPTKHSLLTAFFAMCDEDHNIIDDLDLKLKPADLKDLCVVEEAMKINGINMADHLADPATVTYEEGAVILTEWLKKHNPGKKRDIQPCGHNIQFDKDMIWQQMLPREEWEKIVHYRTLDTTIIVSFLKELGFFPRDVGNLASVVEYLGLPETEFHTARGDVLVNIDVFKAIVATFKEKKNSMLGSANASLLAIIEA